MQSFIEKLEKIKVRSSFDTYQRTHNEEIDKAIATLEVLHGALICLQSIAPESMKAKFEEYIGLGREFFLNSENITGSSNGRKADFDSANVGSSPAPVAINDEELIERMSRAYLNSEQEQHDIWGKVGAGMKDVLAEIRRCSVKPEGSES